MADENKKVSAENTKPAKQVKDKKAEKPAKTAGKILCGFSLAGGIVSV